MALRFSIRDTGIGIPPKKRGSLFTKFSQADASTTRKYGGTGLGLAIAKQLTKLMGGGIGVESTLGGGSEFWFNVDIECQTECAIDLPSALSSQGNLEGMHILVVEGNATSREVLKRSLSSWNMRPAEAVDGVTALLALSTAFQQGDPFQFALIDLQLPGMDGLALGLAIKSNQRLAGTILILLSPMSTHVEPRQFVKIGFTDSLDKPCAIRISLMR